MDDVTLQRLADLIVGTGANVQPGQVLTIGTEPGKEALTRAIAASAYRHEWSRRRSRFPSAACAWSAPWG